MKRLLVLIGALSLAAVAHADLCDPSEPCIGSYNVAGHTMKSGVPAGASFDSNGNLNVAVSGGINVASATIVTSTNIYVTGQSSTTSKVAVYPGAGTNMALETGGNLASLLAQQVVEGSTLSAIQANQTNGTQTAKILNSSLPVTSTNTVISAVTASSTTNSAAAYQAGTWTASVTASSPTFSNTAYIASGQSIALTPATSALTDVAVNFSSTGDNVIVSSTSNTTIKVYRVLILCNSGATVTLKNGTGTSLTGPMTCLTGGSFLFDSASIPYFVTTANNGFIVNQTGSAQLTGFVQYLQN